MFIHVYVYVPLIITRKSNFRRITFPLTIKINVSLISVNVLEWKRIQFGSRK